MLEKEISKIKKTILDDYEKDRAIDWREMFTQPDKEVIINVVNKLSRILYPGYYFDRDFRVYDTKTKISLLIEDVVFNLNRQISIALRFDEQYKDASFETITKKAEEITAEFYSRIPMIREYLDTDLDAAFNGDPAAYYKDEIILSYPGFMAITINRLAHELFILKVPLIPRMMTEYAHSITGIDIHPGATIGKYFFIDHGTGIVVGETTTIGEHVKVYQGVTLGALSTRAGQSLKAVKRHPTIEDNVTIYSGASILGGETVIGEGAVIGSNAFITKSVGAGVRVSIKNQELTFKDGKGKVMDEDFKDNEVWIYNI